MLKLLLIFSQLDYCFKSDSSVKSYGIQEKEFVTYGMLKTDMPK